ncbi:MAG: hypothetical protein P8J87_06785 [Verrucomicrobiales bacterium]|nr:hypothetical protein [Verrucomicrobiales bacterium]
MFTTISELPTDYGEVDRLPDYTSSARNSNRSSLAAHPHRRPAAKKFTTAGTPVDFQLPRLTPLGKVSNNA